MIAAAFSRSASVGAGASCGAYRIRRANAKIITAIAEPTVARRDRDASPYNVNCHHRSFEYSTCLNANEASQADAATAAATAAIHDAEKRVSKNAVLRSNAGRAWRKKMSRTVRSTASS